MSCFVLAFVLAVLVRFSSCQSAIQFQFLGEPLENNSYVYSYRISRGVSALKCLVNTTTAIDCCGNNPRVVNWKDERGRLVQEGADGSSCLYVTREDDGVVNLNRKSNCEHSSGVWRCEGLLEDGELLSLFIYIAGEGCDLTLLVTGAVGGGMGLIVVLQAIVILCLLRCRPVGTRAKKKPSARQPNPSSSGSDLYKTKAVSKSMMSITSASSNKAPTFVIQPRFSVDVEQEEVVETCVNSVYETVSKLSTDMQIYEDVNNVLPTL